MEKNCNRAYELISKFNLASTFGCYLFRNFCNHSDRKRVVIREFDSLPIQLHRVLFDNIEENKDVNDNDYKRGFSLIPITELFPYLEEININDIKYMETCIEKYIDAVIEIIEYINIT